MLHTIGIIREGKKEPDKRSPLSPKQCQELIAFFPGTRIVVQPSPHRCFSDDEYIQAGIPVQEDLSECTLLMGIKEVPVNQLIENKTYLFFSHTIKKQMQNRDLLRQILKKNITLIDYETLVWEAGNRIIGFGRFAGLVGTHYAFLMLGKRSQQFNLPQAAKVQDLEALVSLYKDIQLPPVKIALCGDGRVAHGSLELLRRLGIHEVSRPEFLEQEYDKPVFVQLRSEDYYTHKDGRYWDKSDFYKHPEDYRSDFKPYYQHADILINAIFWHEGIEPFFTHENMKDEDFKIRIISDITCDIPGPLPCTLRNTTISDPIYGYNVFTEKEGDPYAAACITMQTIGNLPCELPIDASHSFGDQLIRHVFPHLLVEDKEKIIENATITREGKLTPNYLYLEDFVS